MTTSGPTARRQPGLFINGQRFPQMSDQDNIKRAIKLYGKIQSAEAELWKLKADLTKLINLMTQNEMCEYLESVKEVEAA